MRFLSVLLAVLLIAGTAFAGITGTPQATDVIFVDGHKEATAVPAVYVKLVRYAFMDPSDIAPALNSGDVVVYDTTSADGVTISGAVTQLTGQGIYAAGVLVTEINTADNATFDDEGDNWGYMAVSGYCLARCDSASVAGNPLIVADAAVVDTGFCTLPQVNISQDIGVCLASPGSDGLAPVILSY